MAPMIPGHSHKTLYIIASLTVVVPALIISSLLFLLYKGVPLHDLRLWILATNFRKVAQYHPQESVLLQRKTYLGGPDEHGSGQCDFFVGELRTAPLSEEKIWQTYENRSIKSLSYLGRTPLKVLFFSEKPWTMNSPLGDWWDEWYLGGIATSTVGTVYVVYASQEGYHFLGDMRCDD